LTTSPARPFATDNAREKVAIGRVLSVSGSEARIGLFADALRSAGDADDAVLSGSLTQKANVIATATGRIGYAANFGDIAGLFYLKGGAAFVNFDTSNFGGQATVTGGSKPGSGAVDFSAPSANRWGWTIGVGTEWAVAENWSIVGEWDFLDLGTQTSTFTDPNLGSTQVSAKQHINELKLGINYRFGNRIPAQYPY
jgi:opacity protein-like surface antigen